MGVPADDSCGHCAVRRIRPPLSADGERCPSAAGAILPRLRCCVLLMGSNRPRSLRASCRCGCDPAGAPAGAGWRANRPQESYRRPETWHRRVEWSSRNRTRVQPAAVIASRAEAAGELSRATGDVDWAAGLHAPYALPVVQRWALVARQALSGWAALRYLSRGARWGAHPDLGQRAAVSPERVVIQVRVQLAGSL